MNIGPIWATVYPHFTDDETRSAQLFTDFICWCHVEKMTNNQARQIFVGAARSADLWLPEDVYVMAFMSYMPKITGQPDPDDQYRRDAPNESVQQRARVFVSAIERFYSGEFHQHPASAAAHLLRDVFEVVDDMNSLCRIIQSGDRKYARTEGREVMYGDEFYSLAEISDYFDPDELGELLTKFGYSKDSDPLVLGKHVIKWRARQGIKWFSEEDDDNDDDNETVPDED